MCYFKPTFDKEYYSNINPRLSGYISILGLVFFVLKSLLAIVRELSREKFAIFVPTLDIQRRL